MSASEVISWNRLNLLFTLCNGGSTTSTFETSCRMFGHTVGNYELVVVPAFCVWQLEDVWTDLFWTTLSIRMCMRFTLVLRRGSSNLEPLHVPIVERCILRIEDVHIWSTTEPNRHGGVANTPDLQFTVTDLPCTYAALAIRAFI